MKSLKILIVTGSLSYGGITSFLIPLVNQLAKQDYNVSLAYTYDEDSFVSRIDSSVRVLRHSRPTKKQLIFDYITRLRLLDLLRIRFRNKRKTDAIAAIQRWGYRTAEITEVCGPMAEDYDVAISASEFCSNKIVAEKINATKKIGWIHPDFSTLKIDLSAERLVHQRLDAIVTVSEAGRQALVEKFPESRDKFFYVENMLDTDWIVKKSEEEIPNIWAGCNGRKIITVCRIDNSAKRVDRVLNIAKVMVEKKENFRWCIVGEGPDLAMVKSLAEQMQLGNHVLFLGKKENPYPYMKSADVFVLTSQYEGKPVVIEEAKALGIPIVSTRYASAEEQILPQYGIVVPNEDGVLEAKIAEALIEGGWLSPPHNISPEYTTKNEESLRKVMSILES